MNVLPDAVIVIGFTLVTVPPVPVADNVPSTKPIPVPNWISVASPLIAPALPNNLAPVTFCIFA